MRKLTSGAFWKCGSFLVLKVLNQSYWLSKFYPNLPKKIHGYIRHIPDILQLWKLLITLLTLTLLTLTFLTLTLTFLTLTLSRERQLLKQMAELRGTSAAVSFKLVLGFAFFTTFDWIAICSLLRVHKLCGFNVGVHKLCVHKMHALNIGVQNCVGSNCVST